MACCQSREKLSSRASDKRMVALVSGLWSMHRLNSSGLLSLGSRSLYPVLSVTTRCCCEIRREAATGGSHAHSFDILASLPADTFWRSAWMDVSPDLTRKRCASFHVHVGRIPLQLFCRAGAKRGAIPPPPSAAPCLLLESVSKPSTLFRERSAKRNFFFFFSRERLRNLDGRVKWLFSGAVRPIQPHKWTLAVTATFRRHSQRKSPQVFSTLKAISSFRTTPQPNSPSPITPHSFSNNLIFLCARLNCDLCDSRLC